ncbi:unnamed protein product [Ectocarpus sp. 12 AP-2014]
MADLQALLPGLGKVELREFLREFLQELNRHRGPERIPREDDTRETADDASQENRSRPPPNKAFGAADNDVMLTCSQAFDHVPQYPTGSPLLSTMALTDRDVLMALFHSTGGAIWKRSDNWNTAAELSTWYGVEVNGEKRVVGLSLAENNLRGHLPNQLGALNKLQTLLLDSNHLTGSIPKELGAVADLTTLALGRNQLAGPIPPELGNLSALTYLELEMNHLSGPIPPELGQLEALETLALEGNQLSGSIPPELGNLSALTYLELGMNQLSAFSRAAAERFAAANMCVSTEGNPWKEPPADVMNMGIANAAVFLGDLDDYGRTWSNHLKVVLVGLCEAGKTSIAARLEDRFGTSCKTPDGRAVGMEIRDIKLGPGPANEGSGSNFELDVSLWDLAGQRAYYDTHQLFLTQGALFVLVVDMFAYSERHSRHDALEQWLNILQAKVPGSVVLLVGTHTDLFEDNADKCAKRMDRFNNDVAEIMAQFRCEYASAKDRAEELGDGPQDMQDFRRYQPLRVVKDEILLALNPSSLEGQDINLLQQRLEHLAYNGHEGCWFSSVRSVLPKPYLPAIATLEAVRRGSGLRGGSATREAVAQSLREGYPERCRSFIGFSEALSLFTDQQYMFSQTSKLFRRGEEERVFLAAIKLHEARGAILLTRADRGEGPEEKHDTGSGAAASAAKLVIHVDPSGFNDLIRRVVDVWLVDPQQQAKVLDAIGACTSVGPTLLRLLDQHERFVKTGEVSREYLQFLWLRDMTMDQASHHAPPLKMTEADIGAMVDSLLDVRFMFQVRDDHRAFVPDRYVVASCLPNNAGPDVDPGKILQMKAGCAIYSQKLKLVGVHAFPFELVPRLLAWCGLREVYIKACWKRGVWFEFKNHMILLYELRATDGTSWVECNASGNMYGNSARRALADIGDQVEDLIRDDKYGFPGLGVVRHGESMEAVVSSYGDHKALIEHIARVLSDQMNVKVMTDRSVRQDLTFLQ